MAHATTDRVAARKQGRTAWRTDLGGRVEISESHPFGRHAIQVRRADAGMTVATQVTPAEIITQHDDDVRPLYSLRRQVL